MSRDPVLTQQSRQSVVFVTGLSGAGKASVLRALEDLGFEAIDNPPAGLIENLVISAPDPDRRIAIGIDVRSHGFNVDAVLDVVTRMRANPALHAALVFAWATEVVLLRRFTETRRRHPLSPQGRVSDGIAAEQLLTGPLQDAADLVMDTTEMSLSALRQRVAQAFGPGADLDSQMLSLSLVSFAYPAGLPREADMVFDARFLRNPHYIDDLRPRTGQDQQVAAYVAADPDFEAFFARMFDLLTLVLPRFVQEGKKYATIAIGCTGGRHRSVMLVEKLARHLSRPDTADPASTRSDPVHSTLAQPRWRVGVTHRELALEAARVVAANRAEP
jgi:UPF0042 nucleotide-binding protein